MAISGTEVKKIAKLARIKVSAQEVVFFGDELNKIMNWIEQLNEVNVDGVLPLSGTEAMPLPLRKDAVAHACTAEEVLRNGPSKYNCFVVPKVVE